MSSEMQSWLVAVVFLSQIAVMSFIAPMRLRAFYVRLFERYPEAEYPRLYPLPQAEMDRQLDRYRRFRFATGPIGFGALVLGLIYAETTRTLVMIMIFFAMLQVLSVLLQLPMQRRLVRALRALPPPPRRSVQLQRWRIGSFVSPVEIGLGLAGVLMAFACAALVYFQTLRFNLLMGMTLLVAALFLSRMLYRLRSPVSPVRSDPYLSETDLFRSRQRTLRALFVASALFGIYMSFMLLLSAHLIELDAVWVGITVSLLLQLLFILLPNRGFRARLALDYSVYRAG